MYFIRSLKFRVIFVVVTMLLLAFSSTLYAGKVQIPKDKEISVVFSENIKISSGVLSEGASLMFQLAEPIEIGGKIIVEKGSEGTAIVKESIKSSKAGKPGRLVLEFVELSPKGDYNTPDEAKIKLSGTISADGKGKKIISYLFIFGLFINGGQGEVIPNVAYTAKIAESIILESK